MKLSGNKSPLIEFLYLEGNPPFICGANGWICYRMMDELETQVTEDIEEIFVKGDGYYQFIANYVSEDREGPYITNKSYWDLKFKNFIKLEDNADNTLPI